MSSNSYMVFIQTQPSAPINEIIFKRGILMIETFYECLIRNYERKFFGKYMD